MKKKVVLLSVLATCVGAALLLTAGAFATGRAPDNATGKTAPASKSAAKHLATTAIIVVEGKPSEFAFQMSKSSNLATGTYIFKVTNKGLGFHTFKVCAKPVAAAANACVGKVTKTLHPGNTATLTVTILKKGKYEFLCSIPGHAAAGMKGLIGVGVTVKKLPVPPVGGGGGGGGGGTTTTAPSGPPEPNGCPAGTPPGTTIGSDEDGDESGAQPDDSDGCL